MPKKAGSLVIDLEARVARLETDMTKATNIVARKLKRIERSAGWLKKRSPHWV